VSEFLVYKSFFRGGVLLDGVTPLALLCSAVGLAFMGGLAVACFTKLYGIVFLGRNRSGDALDRRGEAISSTVVLFGLAALCAVLGVLPGTGLRLIAPVLGEFRAAAAAPGDWPAPLGQLQAGFAVFLGLAGVMCAVKFLLQKWGGVRLRETWGCGYEGATPRMQYTASGFAEELVKLGRPVLALAAHWRPLQNVLPEARNFHSRCDDRMESGWGLLNRTIGRVLGAFRWIQSGNIRHYVLYLFGAVLFYLLCAILWR
jgi:hydrogenase-4 component B